MKVKIVNDVIDDENDATVLVDPSVALPSKPVCRLVGHDDNSPITLVRFTSDGKYCLTVGQDKKIILWNPSRLDPAHSSDYALSATKNQITSTIDDDIAVSNLPRALPIQVYEDGIRYTPAALHINNDSTRILIGSDKTAVLIDCITKKVLRQFHNHTAVINSVSIFMSSGTDQVYATASYDATVCLWDARSSNTYRPIQVLKDAKDSVTVVDIHSSFNDDDDALIRTASVDGIVRTYDIRKGMLQFDDYGSSVVSMASTKNGTVKYFAASCLDGAIRVTNESSNWNRNVVRGASTLSTRPKICRGDHVAGKYALECCFLSNGTHLLTGSENGSAVLYNLTVENRNLERTTDELSKHTLLAPTAREYIGHTAPTCAVAAHPHKNGVIITASYDGNGIVWADSTNPNDYFQ